MATTKAEAPDEGGFVIVHRDFAGEHEMSEACWCRPVVVNADSDCRDGAEIAAETEQLDG